MDTQIYNLVVTRTDFEKISNLLQSAPESVAELLEEELGRALIVSDMDLPLDVVSMNSQVVYKDVETGKETSITLVYPHDAHSEENKVSILAPIGSALIGLKVGQTIHWPFPNGKERTLAVVSVMRPQT